MLKVVSGGQTGVDRAALDVALELKLPCGGWCPKGRKAEDGAITHRYPLKETPSEDYPQRTEWNVRDSDGTLIVTWNTPTGGTKMTIEFARQHRKPCFIVDLNRPPRVEEIHEWILQNKIETLNVAGPRESFNPGQVYKKAKKFLMSAIINLIDIHHPPT